MPETPAVEDHNEPPEENHLEERLATLLSGLTTVHESIDAEREARLLDADARNAENVSRDRRTTRVKVFSIIAAACGVIGLFVGGYGIHTASVANTTANQVQAVIEQNAKDQVTRRIAFCLSLDDVGNAVKAGGNGAIQTFFDPQFQGPNPDPALLQKFVDLYALNGSKAVDEAISQTKQRNGFTNDCQIIR